MKRMLIAVAGLLAGTAVLAQVAPPAASAPTAEAHKGHQKVMTRAEVVQKVREHFGKMDADNNGAVTKAEIEQMRAKVGADMMARRIELRHGDHDLNTAFDRLDANKDGAISREEFAKAHSERVERRVELREKIKEGAAKDGAQMRHHGRVHGGLMIAMADANTDGQITLAEAEALALQHFDQMDSNKDGRVTAEERRAGWHSMMQQRKADKAKSGS